MIIPELKTIDLFPNWKVDPDGEFWIGADAIIGEKGGEGADLFSFRMVTPGLLASKINDEKILFPKATFVVNAPNMEANVELVKKEISKILLSCARETWEEVALAINCYLEWEYYDPSYGICKFYLDTKRKVQDGTYLPSSSTIEEIFGKCNKN